MLLKHLCAFTPTHSSVMVIRIDIPDSRLMLNNKELLEVIDIIGQLKCHAEQEVEQIYKCAV